MKKVYALFIGGVGDGLPELQEVYSSGEKAIKAARKQPKPSPMFDRWQEFKDVPVELDWYQSRRWRAAPKPGLSAGLEADEMYIEVIEVK